MSLTGPVVLDIVQHFVERWNEVKKRKVQGLSQLYDTRLNQEHEERKAVRQLPS